MLIEHLFVGELLRVLWPRRVEVMKPWVDDGGYDLVMEFNGITRHIQLKTSKRDAKTAQQKIHQRLREKPGGCVIWIRFDDREFDLGPFLWFGGPPRERLPCLSGYPIARHTKGDSSGNKSERPEIREIPKRDFTELKDISKVIEKLFGSNA